MTTISLDLEASEHDVGILWRDVRGLAASFRLACRIVRRLVNVLENDESSLTAYGFPICCGDEKSVRPIITGLKTIAPVLLDGKRTGMIIEVDGGSHGSLILRADGFAVSDFWQAIDVAVAESRVLEGLDVVGS